MAHHHLQTTPAVVVAAGGHVAATAGSWSEWGTTARIAFGDAGGAVRNAHLAQAIGDYAATWNPVTQRVVGRVSTLGANVATAGVTVDDADVTAGVPADSDDYDVALAQARQEQLRELRQRWWEAHQQFVDDGSRTAAAMLRDGPTAENLQLLDQAGVWG